MHESPDYLHLKVSVFNDDKKTDLIGETWIDLSSVIIPGGGQSDSWHELKFRNKYAGDIRLEITYYDTRPEDEAVIERRTVVTDKPLSRPGTNPTPTALSSLSGPRQPRPIKRRPLPDDPTGSSPSRPTPVAPAQEYPAPVPQPARPAAEQAPAPAPATSHRQNEARPSSRHSEMPIPMPIPRGSPFSHHDQSTSVGAGNDPADQRDDPYIAQPRPLRVEHNEGYHGEPPRQIHHPVPESHGASYDHDSYQERGSHEAVDSYAQYANQQRPSRADDHLYSAEAIPYIPDRRASQMPPQEYAAIPQTSHLPFEESGHYRYNTAPVQHDPRRQSPLRQLMAPEDDRTTYAAMQPTVEDENDEGLPPPPPVHRMSVSTNRPTSSAGAAGYKPYSPQEYTPQQPEYRDFHRSAAMSPAEQDLAVSMTKPSQAPTRSFYVEPSNSSVPPSLAAGYNVANELVDQEQSAQLDHNYSRGLVTLPSPATANYVPSMPQHQPQASAIQPLRSSPRPVIDNDMRARSRSISPNPRPLSYRKSISPSPPSSDERNVSSVPFSPDSFDALNPRRSPSATREIRSRYATPDREVEVSRSPRADVDDGPIIGDDGRIIDPSDHLPSETWAPEPEKKTKKPEVIIRFKHNPQNSSFSARSSPREQHHSAPTTPDSVVRGSVRPRSSYVVQQPRITHERQHHHTPSMNSYTPPRAVGSIRDYDRHDPYAQPHHASTPPATTTTYSTPPRRRSVSPNPQPRSSPLYSYGDSGPPIPAKVPIATPVSRGYMGAGMDALSQEIQSIDIGPAGYDSGRGVRRYAPRVPVTSGGGYR